MRDYFRHRVYCNAKFRELTNLLSGYLVSHGYYVGDALDGCERFTESDIAFRDFDASVIAAPFKFFLKEYNGLVFRIVNFRRQWAEGDIPYSELPIGLRQRFSICPNYIEIDSNWRLYGLQKDLGKALEDWLTSKGRKSYIRSFNGEFLDIVDTRSSDTEEKADEIHKLIQEFLSKRELESVHLTSFPEHLIWLIPNMHSSTLAALKTAELIRTHVPNLPDSSAVVIEYCKAVEIELHEKLLRPLHSPELRAMTQSVPNLATPGTLDRLRRFIFERSPRPFELGALAMTIDAALKYDFHPIAAALIKNLDKLPFPDHAPHRLIRDILYLTRNFRNPAAHKAILSQEQLEECRNFVIGTVKNPGLLFKILEAS